MSKPAKMPLGKNEMKNISRDLQDKANKIFAPSVADIAIKKALHDIDTKAFLKGKRGLIQRLFGKEITTDEKGRELETPDSLKNYIATQGKVVLTNALWQGLEKDSRSKQGGDIFDKLKTILDAGVIVDKNAIEDTKYSDRYSSPTDLGGRAMMSSKPLSFDEFCNKCEKQFKEKDDKQALKLLKYCTETIKQQSSSVEAPKAFEERTEDKNKRLASTNQGKQNHSENQVSWRDKIASEAKNVKTNGGREQ